jgi:hypothetical protein
MPRNNPLDDLTWHELREALDDEIGKLSEKHRAAVVLCYLEGKTHALAAEQLGWPKRSLTNRLARACELLRQRLVKRGITLSAGALATSLAEKASAAPVHALLSANIVKAATIVAAGEKLAAGVLSTRVIALAEEAIMGMVWTKLKLTLGIVAIILAIGGVSLAGYHVSGGAADESQGAKKIEPVGRENVVTADEQPPKLPKDGPTPKDGDKTDAELLLGKWGFVRSWGGCPVSVIHGLSYSKGGGGIEVTADRIIAHAADYTMELEYKLDPADKRKIDLKLVKVPNKGLGSKDKGMVFKGFCWFETDNRVTIVWTPENGDRPTFVQVWHRIKPAKKSAP